MAGFNSTDDHASDYMDGVRVKISDKFQPPRPVQLPPPFQSLLLASPHTIEYDFSLERRVLRDCERYRESEVEKEKLREEWLEKRKEQRRLEDERRKERENTDKVDQDSNCDKSKSATASQQSSTTSVSESNILTPTPYPKTNESKEIVYDSKVKNINFSDFESETSSPFDSVELKTLNDMEELASVLNAHCSVRNATQQSDAVRQYIPYNYGANYSTASYPHHNHFHKQ